METTKLEGDIKPNDSIEARQSENKKDWILSHGSELLKTSLLAGYSVNLRYLEERLAIEHPEFLLPTDIYVNRTDSPPSFCLDACSKVNGSYCSNSRYQKGKYFLTLDNYLGKHTIVKEITAPASTLNLLEIVEEEEFVLEVKGADRELDSYECEKKDWIFSCGSDVLQQSVLYGYDSTDRYVRERLEIEHPGFDRVNKSDYQRADSPPEYCLQACLSEDSSYCAEQKHYPYGYYLTVNDYLGRHQIAKEIVEPSTSAIDKSSEHDNDSRSKKLQRSHKPLAIFPFAAAVVTCFALIPFAAYYFTFSRTRNPYPISEAASDIESEIVQLRIQRTGLPEVPYSSNKEELSAAVREELKSLSSQESRIEQEMKLNQKLLKELKSKP
ncbi:hypothetical protein [Chamaesiphon sp.]|uniref:hypothetical protein n=1 Tax=Chamaesiphon sp. TaxID=2814140 RepID=UPI0035932505